MEIVSMQNYLNYSAQMNKDAIYNSLRQGSTQNDEVLANQSKEEAIEKIEEEKSIQKEEVVALYFNYEATQAMKSRVDTLFDSSTEEEEDGITFQELRDVQRSINRYENILNMDEDYFHIQNNQIWA